MGDPRHQEFNAISRAKRAKPNKVNAVARKSDFAIKALPLARSVEYAFKLAEQRAQHGKVKILFRNGQRLENPEEVEIDG